MEDKDLHFVGKVAQKAIIEHDGKILVCKGVGDSVWEFPGGRLHKGESPQEGLAREIFEELQLSVTIERPVYTCLPWHAKSQMHNMFVAYVCSVDDISGLQQNEEVVEKKWVTPVELQDLPMFDDCKGAVVEYLYNKIK
ncbi:MAG TPA: NUDIX domain-containing protein [Candidatus Paceibacterota bacterium]|nr:NUDIX domain-containing protein [Candidatus Paceibacterota bacterium]